MKTLAGMGLSQVQAVYDGAEGKLWELIMGEQIHIGGFASSMDLAEKAGIAAGSKGVDLCCCLGAGMRFLVRFRKVAAMRGVDATENMVTVGRQRCQAEGFTSERINFVHSDACRTGLPAGGADFVWGEDAWCYVVDKPGLIAEAARLVKPGGKIAFTDWVLGSTPMSDAEAKRYLTFMKFPNVLSIQEYSDLLSRNGCKVIQACDTGRFAPAVDLYMSMLQNQIAYDALKIIGFDTNLMQMMGGEMQFMRQLAGEGKIVQGLFVAQKSK